MKYDTLEKLLLNNKKIPVGKAEDLTGKKIETFTFLFRIQNKSGSAYWAAKCECGKYVTIRAQHVIQGRTRSCGCKYTNRTANRIYTPNHENLTGKKFGKLTANKQIGVDKNKHALWECTCDCGNVTIVTATHLKTNHTRSCGCSNSSQYEERINNWLIKHNFYFDREVTVPDLGRLRFDFKVYINKEKYIYIEMQGQQHFKPNDKFGGQEAFLKLRKNDKKKKDFCKQNNIFLLCINYNEDIEQILQNNLL